MLRSAATPNRTECNRVRDEKRHNPTPLPTSMTLAAGGVDLPGRQKTAQNAFGVRLFMD
jgi:hypothetical protein